MDSEAWTTKLSALDKRVKAFAQGYGQNIAILGDDSEEISYLLENYLQLNKLDEITYLHTKTTYSGRKEFFKAIAFSLLSDYTHKVDQLDNLINYAAPTLPSTTDFIKERLGRNNLSFLDTLEVINKFINENNRRCVLIVEEFLELENLFGNLYNDFSKFIILQRKCMIVLASSCIKDAEKTLSGELNLLFGNFEKVFLNENNSLNNFLYFKNLLSPFRPSPFFLSFFIHIIGLNSVYYDLMSKIIKNNYCCDDEIGSIISALEEAFCSKETYFFQRFIKKIDLLKSNFRNFVSTIKLLFALAEGYLRKKELASLGICNQGELSNKLQKLLDLNYIENLGNIYRLKDPLFSFWLISVFKFHFSQPVFNPGQRKILCRKSMEESITLFKDEFFKDTLQKILRLFSSFQDDVLRLGKNRYKLPLVRNAKIISYHKKDFHLLVGEGKEIIFAGIKERNTEDSDIVEFLERGASIKGKKVKKIFIAFDNPPHSARLIAKNNNLMLWDVNEVNRLLDIYNQTAVPVNI